MLKFKTFIEISFLSMQVQAGERGEAGVAVEQILVVGRPSVVPAPDLASLHCNTNLSTLSVLHSRHHNTRYCLLFSVCSEIITSFLNTKKKSSNMETFSIPFFVNIRSLK